jgi:dTDP-4-amino-4,6-dideoxygalactose transaminase
MKPLKNPIPITKPLVPDLDKYTEYLKDIFNTGIITNNGPLVRELESNLEKVLGIKNCSVFCNGTTALMIALKALNLDRNEIKRDIITTPFTFPATVNVLNWTNLNPVFCDIDYETMNITPELAERSIDSYVTALMPVHVFGTPCDVYDFQDLAEKLNIKLIYDAAHAFGVEVNNVGVGNFGDITMFSFHPTKLFHTGEGGALTCNDQELHDNIKQLRNFGIEDETIGSVQPGINGKMNELQAAIGLEVLKQVNREKELRKITSDIYYEYLSLIPWVKLLETPGHQYYPIRIQDNRSRDKIHERLLKHNIHSRKYFYPLCTDFKHMKFYRRDLPNAEKVSEEILCLPFYGSLTRDEIEKIYYILLGE